MIALVRLLLAAGLGLTAPASAAAEEALIAVAANFTRPAEDLAAAFQAETGHTIRIATGSTGALYAQIRQSAPYDVFLAADTERPARLVADGLADADTLTPYAMGRLVLVGADTADLPPLDRLRAGDVQRLALANADLAPYGRAAEQVLERLDVCLPERQRLRGQNVAQTLAMFTTGNADLAFIARAQLGGIGPSSASLIPADWHDPIRQDAVLLLQARDNEAARAWMDFLISPTATDILDAYGYGAAE